MNIHFWILVDEVNCPRFLFVWIQFYYQSKISHYEETTINQIDAITEADTDWYTFDGRKLEGKPTEKGIYICNGKKVYVKYNP